MTSWPPITRDDLKAAAGAAGFDSVFPVLIRRLIAETADGLVSLDLPGGSGTASGGFDGVVTTTGVTPFVPDGTSVWELSVEQRPAKADSDYDKRTEAPDNLATTDVSYVQALLAPWAKARAWATAKTAERRWREVRGYNLDRLDAWLETAPATTAWLAGHLGKALAGVRCLTTWWADSWLPSTRTPLDSNIVLAGREKAAADLVAQLGSRRGLITLSGDLRPDEMCAFIAAALEQNGDLSSSPQGVRTLYVSDATSLGQLVAQQSPLILVLADGALARDLPIHHPHQLVLSAAPGTQGHVEVPRLHSQAVEALLLAAGVPRDEAVKLGTLARRSLLALRRTLAHRPEVMTPPWAVSPDTTRRRLLVLGSWSGENHEDRRVVAECLGLPYEEVQEAARQLTVGPDLPFLGHTDELWHLLAVEDAWTLLGSALTTDDLAALRRAVLEVLTDLDPQLDLAPDDRWKATFNAINRRFSGTLRTGLAQSLALLGSGRNGLQLPGGLTGTHWVRGLVRELLAQASADSSYRLWASLTDVLQLLAEAAPEEFLEAMRAGLTGTPAQHVAMFCDNGPDTFGLGGSSPHTAFLWGLEALAWSPDHFDEAVDVLAALTELDPGGRLSNRPLASLIGILSAWCPNTGAGTEHRIRAIERVARQHPDLGHRLLLALIPDGREFQTAHPKPRFREGGTPSSVTQGDLNRVVETAVALLLKQVDGDLAVCLGLIAKADVLAPWHRRELAAHLTELGGALQDDERRAVLFDAVQNKINHHREYPDAHWALPEEQLHDLESARDALSPRSPTLRHAWLFRSDWVTLGDLSRSDDFGAYEAETLRRRADALGDILNNEGIEGVVTLASITEQPHLVGAAFAEHSSAQDTEMMKWLELDVPPQRDVAASYIGHRLRSGGPVLADALLAATGDALTKARLLRFTHAPSISWPKLAELGPEVTSHYWREFNYYGLGDFPEALEAAWSLIDADRPAAALELILLYRRRQEGLEAAEAVAAALEGLLAKGLDDPELGRLGSHSFEEAFALLARHREHLGAERVVRLEWLLFPALGFKPDAPTLHHAITHDPALFVELVTLCFRPASPSVEQEEDGEQQEDRRGRATRAYEVLRSVKRCPGTTPEGELDAVAMCVWVEAARQALQMADRADIGDQQIGGLLAFAPAAEGSLIPPAVRDLLEDVGSDELDRGIAIGVRNQRGTTTRGLLGGGAQEWALSRQFREQAEAAQAWPRARRLLNSLADAYEVDARREDESAERRHQGLGW